MRILKGILASAVFAAAVAGLACNQASDATKAADQAPAAGEPEAKADSPGPNAAPAATPVTPAPESDTAVAPADRTASADDKTGATPGGAAGSPPGSRLSATPASTSTASGAATPQFREVTLPAGTVLALDLQTTVASESSRVEDPVRATVRRPVAIDGVEVIPAGSALSGVVTDVRRPGRVKGRAHVAFHFSTLQARGEQIAVRTSPVARTAPATKKKDAATIGIPAGAGAVIGGIIGGGSGAAKGAAIGGAGGTGVVLATRGQDVRLPAGSNLTVRLVVPLTIRVPVTNVAKEQEEE